MIDPQDLALLDLAEASYNFTTWNTELSHLLVRENDEFFDWAFQGTHDLRDLLTDAEALAQASMPGAGPVSASFYRSTTSVVWRLIPAVVAAKAKGKKVRGTGHSKGAGEALDAAIILTLCGLRPDRLSLWEPARSVGPAALLLVQDIPGIATHVGNDPVPDAPPNWLTRPLTKFAGMDGINLDPFEDHYLRNVRTCVTR